MDTSYGILSLINELAVLQKRASLPDEQALQITNSVFALGAGNGRIIQMLDSQGRQLPKAGE